MSALAVVVPGCDVNYFVRLGAFLLFYHFLFGVFVLQDHLFDSQLFVFVVFVFVVASRR